MSDLDEFDLAGAVWRKSGRSNNNTNCVEVARVWRRSRRSNANNNCVEVAVGGTSLYGTVGVRDSKDPDGPVLIFRADGWTAFLTVTRAGAFAPHR